ncbi:MAG: RluA family pseudouridine synthase [Acidobacteria bacterium]|nr:RluA family pseudouridine synthase [Acidobacteriota bacterium]
MLEKRHFTVSPDDAGQRLDRFLTTQLPDLSRSRIAELIDEGHVRVNGARAKRAHRVAAGEGIEVVVLPRPSLDAVPEAIPLEILYEDDDLLVVNKPAGMTVHGGAGAARGTLVNALLHHFKKLSTVGGPLRPGIVHRLDKDTSGALVVARNDAAHRRLAEQFQKRTVEKTYLALVHGRLKRDAGTIDLPVARDLARRTRMTTRRGEGREARTDWKVLARLESFTLVLVRIHTGRTHQIRVHFSALGHPVVGDTLYGAPRQPRGPRGGVALPPLGRNFLHAARISFEHPRTGRRVTVTAPMPPELERFARELARALGAKEDLLAAVVDAGQGTL